MKTINHKLFYVKNPSTGEYESLPAQRGESAYEAAVRLGKTTLTEEQWLEEYEVKRDDAIEAIEEKGVNTLASIPEDYTTLNDQVSQLSEETASRDAFLGNQIFYRPSTSETYDIGFDNKGFYFRSDGTRHVDVSGQYVGSPAYLIMHGAKRLSTNCYVTGAAGHAFFDENMVFISGFNSYSADIPDSARYVAFSDYNANATHDGKTFAVEYDSSVLIPSDHAAVVQLEKDVATVEENVAELNNKYITNLLNPATVTAGQIINGEGVAVDNASYVSSDYIPVKGLSALYLQHWTASTSNPYRVIAAYNSEKTYITGSYTAYPTEYTVPDDAEYVRVTYSSWADPTFMAVCQEKLGEYLAYGESYLSPKYISLPIRMCHAYLPSELYVASGRTIELYNDQVCLEAEAYHFQWYCKNASNQYIGKNMARKFSITGSDDVIGDYTLTCNIYTDKMVTVWSGTCTVHVVADGVSTAKSICPIGDSLTNNKPWMAEVINLSNAKVSYVGTYPLAITDADGTARGGGHEGRSGFTAERYVNGSPYTFGGATETPNNKFWNPASEKFDWNYYRSQNSIACDAVEIFLGTNAVKGVNIDTETTNEVAYLKTMVDSILADQTGKTILIVQPPYFGNQNGMGNQSATDNFTSDATRWQYKQYRGVMLLMEKIEATFADYPSVHIIPVATTHDSKYNYGAVETPVNPRAVQVEFLPSEAAHPQPQGYYQMADIMYSTYCGVFG